jgi:hypothetical protein
MTDIEDYTMTKTSPQRRNADLATIHIGAKALFGDVSKGGDGRDQYEVWLERHTGKRSAGKLSTDQRIDLIKMMRKEGLLPDRTPGGKGPTANGEERPTSAQWAKMAAIGRSVGWSDGLEDERLRSFVKRTAKVSSTKFLSRTQASKVIMGLESWAAQQKSKTEGDANAVS